MAAEIANFSSGVGAVAPAPSSTLPTSSTQSSALGQQIASKISQARTQYPGQDDTVLQAFIRDNQKTLPTVVQKVQGLISNDRAMRNNNPTAMTTDVATSLGLKEGQDYTQGDEFGDGYHTAKLNGDPMQTTIKAFDNAAINNTPIFQTQGGKPRWSYINLTNDQWKALTPQQKADTINHMKTSGEGSKGYSATQILNSLVQDNQSSNPQSTPTNDTNSVVEDNFSLGNVLKNTANAVFEPEDKAIATATRAIQATPQVFGAVKNAIQGKDFSQDVNQANETMATPVLGQKTLEGSSIDENLATAGNATLQALALASPDIIGAFQNGGIKAALQEAGMVKGLSIARKALAVKGVIDAIKAKQITVPAALEVLQEFYKP